MKWSRENYYHNLSSPYCLRLASGDASGKIIVWDVVSGTAHCEIQEHSKPIQGTGIHPWFNYFCISSTHSSISFSVLFCLSLPDLEWLWNQDASRDLLLAIHPPNYIVLWNGDTGTKLWKKSYAENILSFSFDPFDPSNMARKWFSPLFQMFYRVSQAPKNVNCHFFACAILCLVCFQ